MTLISGYKGFPVSSGTGSSIQTSVPQSASTHTYTHVNTNHPQSLRFLKLPVCRQCVCVRAGGVMFGTSVHADSQLTNKGDVRIA